MWELLNILPTTPVKTLDALEVFFGHLDHKVPKEPGPRASEEERERCRDIQQRATIVFGAIAKARFEHESESEPRFTNIFLANLEPLIVWQRHFVVKLGLYSYKELFESLLLMYTNRGKELQMAMLYSPCAMESLVITLCVPFPEMNRVGQEYRDCDAYVTALHLCLTHDVSREMMFNKLMRRPRASINTFISNLNWLVDFTHFWLRDAMTKRHPPLPQILAMMDGDNIHKHRPLEVIIMLYTNIHAILDWFSLDMRTARYLRKTDYLVNHLRFTLDVDKVASEKDFRNHRIILTHFTDIFYWALYQRSHAIGPLTKLLREGNIFEIFIDALCTDALDIRDVRRVTAVLISLLGSRRIANSLGSAVKEMDMDTQGTLLDESESVSRYLAWSQFLSFCAYQEEAREDVHEDDPVLCSNLDHRTDTTIQPGVRVVPKACRACYAVSYCCRECQAKDWAEVHRHECRSLRAQCTAMKQQSIWVPFHIRQQYLIAMQRFLSHMGSEFSNMMERPVARQCANDPRADVVYVNRNFVFGADQAMNVDRYRAQAIQYYLWSEERYQSVRDHVRAYNDKIEEKRARRLARGAPARKGKQEARLMACSMGYSTFVLHALCVVYPGTAAAVDGMAKSERGPTFQCGMMQIELIPARPIAPTCLSTCCEGSPVAHQPLPKII